jgi:hypothetical protein
MKNAIAIAKQLDAVLLPDNQQWTNRFEIKSASSSRLYTIAQRKSDHSWGCSCPGWKSHRNCKHLAKLQSSLKQIGA